MIGWEYVIVLGFVSISVIFDWTEYRNKRVPRLFLFVILLLLAGTRFETGNDWSEYTRAMQNIPSLFTSMNLEDFRMEPGYLLLNRIVKTLGGDVNALFFITVFFSLIAIYNFIFRYSPLPFFSLLLYMRYLYLQSNMMFLRQSIVIGIFLFGLKYIFERKFLAYIGLIIIAMTFHLSAIVLIPIYFLYDLRLKNTNILLLAFITLLFTQLRWLEITANYIPITSIKMIVLGYLSSERWSVPVGISFSVIERFTFFWILLYYRKKLDSLFPKHFNLFYNMFLVGFFISLFFFQYNVFLERFILYFNVASIIVLAYCVYVFKNKSRIIYIFGILLLCAYWFVNYINAPNSPYIPYKSFLY